MNRDIEQVLQATLQNWDAMALAEHEDSETAANAFESDFYRFIDAARE